MRFNLLYLLLLFPLISFSQSITGKVVRVADGDTVTLLDSTNTQIRIRLFGIDCPENGQDFGNEKQLSFRFNSSDQGDT